MDDILERQNHDKMDSDNKRNPENLYGEWIAFFVCFNAFFYIHQINMGSSHYSLAFKIPFKNVGIYYSKLLGLRTTLVIVGSSIQNYILLYDYDLILISTITSFSLLLISRIAFMLLMYQKDHLSLNVFMVLNVEAFFFGLFQISLFAFFPEFPSMTNLSVELSGLFVIVINTILDTLLKNKPLEIIKIQNWTYVLTNLASIVLYTHYVLVYKYRNNLEMIENDCRFQKRKGIEQIVQFLRKMIMIFKKLRTVNHNDLENRIFQINGLHREIDDLKEIKKFEIFPELDGFFEKAYEQIVIIENIVCVNLVLNFLEKNQTGYPHNQESLYKYEEFINKLKNKANIKGITDSFTGFYNELNNIKNILSNDEDLKKLKDNDNFIPEIKKYDDIEKIMEMCERIKGIKGKNDHRGWGDRNYIQNLIYYLKDFKENIDDLKNIKRKGESIQKEKLENIHELENLIELLKKELPESLRIIEDLLVELKELIFDKYIKIDIFIREDNPQIFESDDEIGKNLNKTTMAVVDAISLYQRVLEENQVKTIDMCYFDKLKSSISPFLMIIPSSFIYQFLFPYILPYGLLKLKNSHSSKLFLSIIACLCKIKIYFMNDFEKRMKKWERDYCMIWSLLIPKFGILILSILAIHHEIFTKSIVGSNFKVWLMTILMVICYTFLKSFSYIGVADYVYYKSNRKYSSGFLMSHNIMAIFLSYMFSKIAIGYNLTRARTGYTFPHFKPIDPMSNTLSFWIKMTFRNGCSDFIRNFKMDLKKYL